MITITIEHDADETPIPHQFKTAVEAAKFLNSLLAYPLGQSTIIIRQSVPRTGYRVMCEAKDGSQRWVQITTPCSSRTVANEHEGTVFETLRDAISWADYADNLPADEFRAVRLAR
jgi:hypothetical protein